MKKMKIKMKCQSIKLILIIILLENITTKTILIANGISNGKCHNEIDEYSYNFNIKAVLTGNLSQSMLDKFKIKNNYNDNNLKIKCNITEEKKFVNNENILINCYINNIIYNNISLYFEGASDNLELINFNEKYLYLENIFCKKVIILMLGEIKDEKCKNNNSLFYYNYKIEILNNTIPTELFNNNFDLSPTNLNNNENDNDYNITCNIVNNDNNYFFNCSLLCYKQINNYIYYNNGYIYKKEINTNIIYIKNLNDNLYIGKNFDVNCQYKSGIKNKGLRNIEIYSSDTDNNQIDPSDIPPNPTTTSPSTNNTEFEKTCEHDEFLNADNECNKCFSLCEKCDSFDNCTKCKNDINYFIQKKAPNRCISCFSQYEGCETCNQNECTKCYNNSIFQFVLRNGKCETEQDYNNKEINLKYKQFDGYKKIDNKIYFNCHFVLLNNYLYDAKLYLYNTIIITNKRILRDLTKTQDIICYQYGDSLGDVNNGYLANFECSLSLDNGEELFSIQPESLEIISKNNKITIKGYKSEAIEKDFLKATSLDIEYENYNFNKFSISVISNIKLNNDLTFNIKGEYIKSKDIITNTDSNYDIKLKYNNSEEITSTCNFKEETNDTLSCTIYSNDIKEQETLSFIEDIYGSANANEKLILINLNDATVKVPKSTLSVGAIVGITIAGIVILVPFIYYIAKYFIEKKELNNENEGNGIGNEEVNRAGIPQINEGNSKEIIFNP